MFFSFSYFSVLEITISAPFRGGQGLPLCICDIFGFSITPLISVIPSGIQPALFLSLGIYNTVHDMSISVCRPCTLVQVLQQDVRMPFHVLASLKTMISLQSLQQQLIDIAPEPSFDRPDNLNNLPEDDFVIVDESAVKIYEFPDCIYIPIGNSRIKMPTSILLTLINLIISTILTISIAVVQFNSSQEDQIKQTQIEETQIELQRAQNEILQQLLHNIDTSSSSEAEAIKELQKTVEEQNKQYSQNQDTCLSVEEDNDNSKLTKDTDTPK